MQNVVSHALRNLTDFSHQHKWPRLYSRQEKALTVQNATSRYMARHLGAYSVTSRDITRYQGIKNIHWKLRTKLGDHFAFLGRICDDIRRLAFPGSANVKHTWCKPTLFREHSRWRTSINFTQLYKKRNILKTKQGAVCSKGVYS